MHPFSGTHDVRRSRGHTLTMGDSHCKRTVSPWKATAFNHGPRHIKEHPEFTRPPVPAHAMHFVTAILYPELVECVVTVGSRGPEAANITGLHGLSAQRSPYVVVQYHYQDDGCLNNSASCYNWRGSFEAEDVPQSSRSRQYSETLNPEKECVVLTQRRGGQKLL